jgi:AraC-like DNA-binding protein
MLETSRTISSIARMEGYEDPYHFSRVFKRITGQAPTDYRVRFSQTEERSQSQQC